METVQTTSTITSVLNFISFAPLILAIVWVYLDAKAIGSDGGRSPGLVETKPVAWATGVFLALIVVLPIYLFRRVGYKRELAQRKAQAAAIAAQDPDTEGVWPPPPAKPYA